MHPDNSVTQWIERLKAGDDEAARALWERYFAQLVRLCERRLQDSPRRAADGEDVALSAFASFCRAARDGAFESLVHREDLWQLLAVIARRKAVDQLKHEGRQKRGAFRVRGESALAVPAAGGTEGGLDQVPGKELSPTVAALVSEAYEQLLGSLGDETLQTIARWKLEGCENREIADRVGLSLRSVERKLKVIRELWQERR